MLEDQDLKLTQQSWSTGKSGCCPLMFQRPGLPTAGISLYCSLHKIFQIHWEYQQTNVSVLPQQRNSSYIQSVPISKPHVNRKNSRGVKSNIILFLLQIGQLGRHRTPSYTLHKEGTISQSADPTLAPQNPREFEGRQAIGNH